MSELSPAAQAVDDAYWKTINDKWDIYDRHRARIAAALRAAADEVCLRWAELEHPADVLKAIATELEAQ